MYVREFFAVERSFQTKRADLVYDLIKGVKVR